MHSSLAFSRSLFCPSKSVIFCEMSFIFLVTSLMPFCLFLPSRMIFSLFVCSSLASSTFLFRASSASFRFPSATVRASCIREREKERKGGGGGLTEAALYIIFLNYKGYLSWNIVVIDAKIGVACYNASFQILDITLFPSRKA